MPIKHAAIKALRKSKKTNLKNKAIKEKLVKMRKNLREAIKSADKTKLNQLVRDWQQACDKAVKCGVFKKNKAGRLTSRAMKLVSKK
ncbi:MAG: 30S ribosomal protein S20 [Patescibacteria group bacterium]